MKMRLHEAVRSNSHRPFRARALHDAQEGIMILATIEQHALSRASIEHVIHVTAGCEPMMPSHDENRVAIGRPAPAASRPRNFGGRPRIAAAGGAMGSDPGGWR